MPRLVIVNSASTIPGVLSRFTDIDANNNLTISGVPILLIQAAHCSYYYFAGSAGPAGYTEAQATAKIQQMKAAGVNCGESGANAVPSLAPPWNTVKDVDVMWQRHGIYGHGAGGNITIPPAAEQSFAALQAAMAGDLGKPYLLIWLASGEVNPPADIATYTTYVKDHVSQIGQIDPAHAVTYSYGTGANYETYFNHWIGAQALRLPFFEYAPGQKDSSGFILRPLPFFTLMNIGTGYRSTDDANPLNVMAHPEGVGYVPGISYTWCTELFEKFQPNYAPSQDELDRLFWLQVAMNARAFNIYNGAAFRQASFNPNLSANAKVYVSSSSGSDTQLVYLDGLATDGVTEISETFNLVAGSALSANTYSAVKFSGPSYPTMFPSLANVWTYRQGGSGGTILGQTQGTAGQNGICGSGDLGLPIGMLGVWNNLWNTTVPNVVSLTSVILAPGNWMQITAVTPAWSPPNFDTNSGSHTTGIYAAKKSYGGVLYVIAVNMNMHWTGTQTLDDTIPGGTIDVGQTINTVTRLFEGGSPTFSGSQITGEAFRIGQVHVYRIT